MGIGQLLRGLRPLRSQVVTLTRKALRAIPHGVLARGHTRRTGTSKNRERQYCSRGRCHNNRTVKLPDKIELDHWPVLPMFRTSLISSYAFWRVLTGGADHTEEYMRMAGLKAKVTEKEFWLQLEDCYCSDPRNSLTEEEFGELMKKCQHISRRISPSWPRPGE